MRVCHVFGGATLNLEWARILVIKKRTSWAMVSFFGVELIATS